MIITKLNKLTGILLFTLLIIFPFSYTKLTVKWDIALGIVLGGIVLLRILKKNMNLKKPLLFSVFSIIFLLLFDFMEIVNFSQLLYIQNPLGWRIPLSTIILSFAILVFIIKILLEKKLVFNFPEYLKYFLIAVLFFIILMVLFFPFMKFHYSMSISSNIQLLNKVLKYAILLVLILSQLSNEDFFKKLNIGLIASISIALALNIFF